MDDMKTILNIAAGKFSPIEMPKKEFKLINLDTMYFDSSSPKEVERAMNSTKEDSIFECNCDAFKFMERTSLMFNEIVCYRFLEHVSFDRVPYFIYLMSTVLEVDGILDCIIPNYKTLADMILRESIDYEVGGKGWEAYNTLLTTELLNEPGCPHASIWTVDRVKYYMEFEGRFRVDVIDPAYKFDGRDIYIRFIAKRI